jgi:hypothetical protein
VRLFPLSHSPQKNQQGTYFKQTIFIYMTADEDEKMGEAWEETITAKSESSSSISHPTKNRNKTTKSHISINNVA